MALGNFTDRTKKWLDGGRANLLRSLLAAIARDSQRKISRICITYSKAKTLSGLKHELKDLSAGMCLALKVQDFVLLLSSRDGWLRSRRFAEEFGCEVEFRPDGRIWFVKREVAR